MQSAPDLPPSREHVKEFLLEEYRNFSESLWKNEQTGETRVNWFIGIVTAAAGGLIGLTTADRHPQGESLRLIFVASLFALIVFGLITLLRIIKRNETTDGYKNDTDRVRQLFKDHFDDEKLLRKYHPFGKPNEKNLMRKLGGLAHTVLAINSLLFAGLVAASVFPLGDPTRIWMVYVKSIVGFLFAARLQFWWVNRAETKAKQRLASTRSSLTFPFDGNGKIYFAGSIRGGRSDAALYYEIVQLLRNYGEVLTEHVGDTELGVLGQDIGDRQIHDRDIAWLRDSDYLVAEVTNPSLGVGYEIGKATEWGTPVLCLYRPAGGRSLSAMIAGCEAVTVQEYQSPAALPEIFEEFLRPGNSGIGKEN